MSNNLQKLEQFIQFNTSYYIDGEYFHLTKNRELIKKSKQDSRLLVVSSKHVLERKAFFKITKKKDLKLAITLFTDKNNPFSNSYIWTQAFRSKDGFFIVAYYADAQLIETLKENQPKGGLILPEQFIVRCNGDELIGKIDGVGEYLHDANYKALFLHQQKGVLQHLLSANAGHQSLEEFVEKLIGSINYSLLSQSFNYIHLGSKLNFTLTVGHVAAIVACGVFYFTATSAFLNWDYKIAQERYESSKSLLQDMNAQQRTVDEKRQQLRSLSEPFRDYKYSYEIFGVLSDLKEPLDIQSLVINGSEVGLGGSSLNARAVFRELSDNPRVKEIKYVRPIRKAGELERFTIGFKLISK